MRFDRVGDTPVPVGSFIEVGYFTGGTASFAGLWTPLANGVIDVPFPGYTVTAFAIDPDDPSAPATGTLLGLRFYDSTDNSGSYNAVTKTGDGTWNYPDTGGAGVPTPQNLNLLNATFNGPHPDLLWEDPANPFTLSIPEPSSLLLLCLGAWSLFSRRQRD